MEICYSSAAAPKLISDLLAERKAISLWGCVTQIFFIHIFGGTEMFLFTWWLMTTTWPSVSPRTIPPWWTSRCVLSWWEQHGWGGFVHSFAQILLIFHLPSCGPNVINHYFCDLLPLLKLACSDTFLIGLLIIANGGTLSVISFVVLLTSYVVILVHLRTQNSEGQSKALSTGGSQIIVVS